MKRFHCHLWILLLCVIALQPTWAATPVKIGFPLQVALGVKSSIELEFETEAGRIYQVEVSSDLKQWANDGYAIVGQGGRQTHITSTYNLPHLYFRVRNDGDRGRVLGGGTPGPAGPPGPQGPPGETPTDYATSAQGAKADTALQPDDLGAAGSVLLEAESTPEVRDLLADNPVLPLTASRILHSEQLTFDPYRITFIATGDSYAPGVGNQIQLNLVSKSADGMGYIGTQYALEGGATPANADFSYSPNGQYALLDQPSEAVIYPKTAQTAYKVHVFYTTEPGVLGSFTVQSKTESGAWTDIPGGVAINTNAPNPEGSPIGAGVFTYSFPNSQTRQFRAIWNSGTVRILGIVRSDVWLGSSTKGGLASYDLSFSGKTVEDASKCPQAVFDTILGTLKPDFAAFKADDNASQMSHLETYLAKWNAAWPTDWMLFSSHPTGGSPTRELTDADRIVQSVADRRLYTFINCRKLFGTCAEMISLGFLNQDNYHLSPYGSSYMERFAYSVIESAIQPRDVYTNPTYYSPNTDYPVLAFDNAYGGASIPTRIWSAQYNATNGSFQFNIGPNGIGRFGWSPGGNLFITGGNAGWGYSNPPGKAKREPRATAEIFADDWVSAPTLTLSAKSNHTSDALEIVNSATQTTPGTRTAGIKPNGAADFTALKLNLASYSSHAAADADSNLLGGQLYKLSGSRAVYQKP